MVVAAAIGAVATVGGTAISSSASNKAANAAKDAAAQSNALQTDIYNQNKATLAPFVGTGSNATKSIEALLGLGGDSTAANAAFDAYKASTGYQTQLDQGLKSVQAALGAKGLLDSGAALKGINNYAQSQALTAFQGYLGNLQTQQQTGLAAASAQAGVGANYANAVSSNNANAANDVGNAALASASSINSLLGAGLSAYGFLKGQRSSYGNSGSGFGSRVSLGGSDYGSGGLTGDIWGF